jgi:hypothetical protein
MKFLIVEPSPLLALLRGESGNKYIYYMKTLYFYCLFFTVVPITSSVFFPVGLSSLTRFFPTGLVVYSVS